MQSLTDFLKWISPKSAKTPGKAMGKPASIDLEAASQVAKIVKPKKEQKQKKKKKIKVHIQQPHLSAAAAEVDDVNLPSSSAEASPTLSATATQSVVHSAKNELSLQPKDVHCPVSTATIMRKAALPPPQGSEQKKKKKNKSAQKVASAEVPVAPVSPPPPPMISLPISEYVSVNEQAKSLEEGGLSELAIRLLHKRRLKERGFRLSGGKMLGEGGFGAVFKVYRDGDRAQPFACKVMLLSKDGRNRGKKQQQQQNKEEGDEGNKEEKKDAMAIAKRKKAAAAAAALVPMANVVGANPAAVHSMLQTFSSEVFVMSQCSHPNLVALQQYFIYSHSRSTEETVMMHSYLIMDYASQGTLYGKLKKCGPFEEDAARGYFVQIANAVEHLHARGIAHRDLKLGNILLALEDGRELLKVTDFGLSRPVHTEQSGLVLFNKPAGTMSYMAPELVDSYVLYNSGQRKHIRPYDCFAVDIWALGVCLYMLLAKVHPFGSPPADKAERVAFAKMMHARQLAEEWEPLPEAVQAAISWPCFALLQALLEVKPEQRLTIGEVMQQQWMKQQQQLEQMPEQKQQML